ncbi:hypothetical protein ACSTS3_04220 [Aquimarina muelleri]|uniref:hypothetical protein n=1 Tax=Aquimarina muelleri TaxID=279356 RepID=UPI003F68271A
MKYFFLILSFSVCTLSYSQSNKYYSEYQVLSGDEFYDKYSIKINGQESIIIEDDSGIFKNFNIISSNGNQEYRLMSLLDTYTFRIFPSEGRNSQGFIYNYIIEIVNENENQDEFYTFYVKR